jgi:hypothetical protein
MQRKVPRLQLQGAEWAGFVLENENERTFGLRQRDTNALSTKKRATMKIAVSATSSLKPCSAPPSWKSGDNGGGARMATKVSINNTAVFCCIYRMASNVLNGAVFYTNGLWVIAC